MKNEKLHTIKNSGFKVPENYFTELEDTILAEAKLKGLVNESGFKTPENYIDTFKISFKKETKVISIFNKRNMLLVSSIAAVIVLFFNVNLFGNTPLSINDLDTKTVDNYILEEANASELADLFEDNELNETQFINYDISDHTLESYLESVEVNELYIE